MTRKLRPAFIAAVVSAIVFLNSVHNHFFRNPSLITAEDLLAPPLPLYLLANTRYANRDDEDQEVSYNYKISRHVISVQEPISTVSVLLPAWEVLVILSPEASPSDNSGQFTCLFPNNDSSRARLSGILSSYLLAFKCDFPERLRRRFPLHQPLLTRSPENQPQSTNFISLVPELIRWNFLVYDSFTTEKDVVVFAKGINNRQRSGRSPTDFNCVFGDGIRTAVTTSFQEVFRCQLPELTDVPSSGAKERIKISLEILQQNIMVPSVAYYAPNLKTAVNQPKSLICACTMVYNVAKFLKEWVIYHSTIGVERFILYDNESDDDLDIVVQELIQLGYNVNALFWIWPKTQEAGFSHCAIAANDSCKWITFIDVDEFIYSPSWINSSNPSHEMMQSLLPKSETFSIGQILISCYEFGPSNQKSNPKTGVVQGYNCRRRDDNRHKSIVLLDAIDDSLLNVVHHFRLKQGYRGKKLRMTDAVVNHYKYQAWEEFRTKFRRRVSAYVVDWTKEVNRASKDRTPGLGFAPVEPNKWEEKFCDVRDDRLRNLTQLWFRFSFGNTHMDWLN